MSKNRKFRSKLSFDEDEGEGGAAAAPPPAAKEPKPRKGALLSFDDDGEDGGMAGSSNKKSSKSSLSKFHRGTLPPPAAAAPAPARTGEYTAERLKELAAATPSLPASKKPPAGAAGFPGSAAAGAAGGGLGVIKLSGSFKPAGGTAGGAGFGHKVTSSTSRPLTAAAGGADEDMPLPPPPRSLKGSTIGAVAAAGGGSRGGLPASAAGGGAAGLGRQQQQLGEQIGEAISVVESDEEEDGFTIPGDDAIRLAKAKRERLRQAQLAPDYVPLGGASALMASSAADRRRGAAEAEGPASEPDSEEEPEDHLRMAFLGTGGAAAGAAGGAGRGPGSRRGAAAAGGSRGGLMHPADDDEEAFEEEQLRRALPARLGASAAAGGGKERGAAAVWGGAGPGRPGASARRMEDVSAAGEGVVSALQAALARAQMTQAQLEGNAARTADNLNDALAAIDKLQEDIKATGAKYTYVQGIRGYLADLCDCLADKGPLVEELEEALLGLREEAAAGGRAEVAEDLQVLLQQGEAAVAAAIRILGTGGTPGAAASAASAAAAAAEEAALDALAAAAAARGRGGEANGADGEEEVDEFGRDVSKMRRREVAAGGGRRAALVDRFQQQLEAVRAGAPLSDALTTTSSSSSSTSTALQRYFTKRSEVLEVVPTVFADAAEEYASLGSVKSRLEDWKAAYPRDYQNAYVPESAPALFAPFVRLQLLRWDPLHGQGQGQSQHQVARSFDQQDWYGQLFEYGMAGQDAAAAAAAADDPDANLVPQLVESLVLPQAMHLVKHCWDPFDFHQSRAVTALLTDLFVYVPADKADMGQLTSLTVTRLEEAVAAAAVPPWPAAAAAASPLAAAVQQWCFVRAVLVLRALMGLKELLSQSVLVKLGVTGLLTKQLLPCLRGSTQELTLAVARAEAVISSIPEAWFPERGGWPEAQPLLDWLASLASTLESQPVNSSTGLTNRVLTSRLVGVLQRVKLQDRARQLEARAAAAAAAGGGGR